MENLDPQAVQYANEELWRQYPELHRRQLVMPQDANYASDWLKHYKAYKKAQLAPAPKTAPQPAAQPQAPAPSTPPPPQPVAQPCAGCASCGAGSAKCKDALDKGVDANGNAIPPEVHARIKATNETIRSRMKLAKSMGYTRAVDALDYWFNGCGKFKEMPADKAGETKESSWETHRTMLKPKLAAGLKSKLAYAAHQTRNLARLNVTMAWKGGGSASGLLWSDDNLAYYGATIHSRVVYDCKQLPQERGPAPAAAKPICYECTAVEWKSWAEDNYDFESGKGVPGLPTDAEMNELARYGCGANYQRSSKSWSTDPKELTQTFCYSNDMEMRQAATQRHFMNQAEARQEAAEQSRGALKSAPPAEEALKP